MNASEQAGDRDGLGAALDVRRMHQLRFLDDPKKVFGEAEHVDNIVNPGLEAKAKPVILFLKKFQWKPGEIDSVMLAIQGGTKRTRRRMRGSPRMGTA
ncbi:glycine betaine ABC transporter substrate-binding protein [Cupriavidus basilensis]